MPSLENPWDILGKNNFNVHVKKGEIDPSAADNILIAWPPILSQLNKSFPNPKGIKVLDYGCGTGGFCNELASLGYDMTGIDTSAEMINTAKHNSSKSISYFVGNENVIPLNEEYNVIVSIMTAPFIKDLDGALRALIAHLRKDGLLFVVDFNREWVKESLRRKLWFVHFDSSDFPKEGMKTFGSLSTPVYIRDSSDYEELTKTNNFKRILNVSPPFTSKFIKKYPEYTPVNVPEYLILGYKKL